ncbi:MAG: hypothetical protein RDU14_03490 [Melioribacteraceae bacterium]|nr:hypothetical protein [Melioribacteraceae bacterium]
MNQILHILRYKLIIFIRLNTRFDLPGLLKNIGSSIIYIVFASGAFFFTKKFVWFLISEIKIGMFLLHEFISIILFIFFLAINIGNILVSYSTLYKSNEVGFLITKPLNPSKVFILKFLDNFFYSSSTLLFILLAVLAGYASYFQLKFTYLLILIFLNFIPFMFSAGSLGVIILMLLIKLASRFNPRKVIYGLVFTYLSVVFIFFKINSPVSLATTVMNFYPLIDKDKYLRELISPLIKFLPNNWLSETAYWLTNNNLSEAIPLIVLQIGCSILLFSIAVSIGKHWYFKTWLMNLKLTADNIALRKNSKSFFSFLNNSLFSPRTESIIKKDFWMFVREPSQWLHFLILLFMIMIFILSVAGIRYVGLGNFYLQTGIYLSVFLFNLLLISTISLRFVFPLISLEGESFWKLKSAPLDRYYIINKKLTSWGIIILLISTGLSYFSNHRFELQIELMAFVVNIIASITIAIINLGMGGLFANYKEKNAIRLSSSQGASITFLINIVYILFIVLLLFNPMSNYFLAIMLTRGFNMLSILYPLIPITIVSFLLIGVFIRAAYNSIQKDF